MEDVDDVFGLELEDMDMVERHEPKGVASKKIDSLLEVVFKGSTPFLCAYVLAGEDAARVWKSPSRLHESFILSLVGMGCFSAPGDIDLNWAETFGKAITTESAHEMFEPPPLVGADESVANALSEVISIFKDKDGFTKAEKSQMSWFLVYATGEMCGKIPVLKCESGGYAWKEFPVIKFLSVVLGQLTQEYPFVDYQILLNTIDTFSVDKNSILQVAFKRAFPEPPLPNQQQVSLIDRLLIDVAAPSDGGDGGGRENEPLGNGESESQAMEVDDDDDDDLDENDAQEEEPRDGESV